MVQDIPTGAATVKCKLFYMSKAQAEFRLNLFPLRFFRLSSPFPIAVAHSLGSDLLMVIYYGLSLYWLQHFQLPY